MRSALVLMTALGTTLGVAHAAPPEPSNAHPRMLLTPELTAAWKKLATQERGPIAGSIALCESGTSKEHDRAVYQGSEWSRVLQACLVAYVATGSDAHAQTAIKFFTALIDDLDMIGDAKGGNEAARRDSGYALRNLGPYTALAYDWLHAKLPPALRQRARERWAAWLDWYADKGYRAREPGTNYQAGFLAASTLIAIAQAGEAAEQNGAKRWAFVADELWGKDMAKALAPGGILDGGDWPEGWQYGPLSIAHYAIAARVARQAGLRTDGIDRYLHAVLQRHVYALSPADRVYVGQDSEADTPNVAPNPLTLAAVALGDASADDQRLARGELFRLKVADKDYFLYTALATTGDGTPIARATWPTMYTAPATGTVYTRTRWDEKAIWFISECAPYVPVDHRHPKAGNFVLSRGADDAIVDPSPYGSASSITSNAPTVVSPHFPTEYKPSQGQWGGSRFQFATQTKSGVVATRCDYAGAYVLQKEPSDIPFAQRDLVLLPNADGTDAALLVVDRAKASSLHLRFRVAGGLALNNDVGDKTFGSTHLTINSIARSSGRAAVGRSSAKDCFGKDVIKGKCDAGRFESSDYRVEVTGPEPFAAHLIGVTDQRAQPIVSKPLTGDNYAGVTLTSPRAATVVWSTKGGALDYTSAPGTHVVLDAPNVGGRAAVTATKAADGQCAVHVVPGGTFETTPLVVTLDASCAIAVDASTSTAASAAKTVAPNTPAPVPATSRASRSGCCSASSSTAHPLLAVGVLALIRRRRRR